MIAIATRFISFSSLTIPSTLVMWKSSQWLGNIFILNTLSKKLKESMDMCTCRRYINKMNLKTALNNKINQSIFPRIDDSHCNRILSSPLSRCRLLGKVASCLSRILCGVSIRRNSRKSMNKCTDCH